MTKRRGSTKQTNTRRRAREVTKDRKNIKENVRELALQVIHERNVSIDNLSEVAHEILNGAASAIRELLPSSRESALKQVVDGLSEAWAITAEASAASLRHAQRYGMRLAKQDLNRLNKRLQSLEHEFVSSLEHFASHLKDDLSAELNSLTARLRRSGTAIAPAVENARKAIVEHGSDLVGEVATVSMRASQQALSGALLAVSGLLEGVGKAVRPSAATKRNKGGR